MPFFLDRGRDGEDDPWLLAKVRLFAIGAGLALGGILLDSEWLVWAAIGALVAGVLLRFVPVREQRDDVATDPDRDDPAT
jgi:hypothetical protein